MRVDITGAIKTYSTAALNTLLDLILWYIEVTIVYKVAQKDALKTSHCLMRILTQRHNWAIFLRK